MRIGLFTDTYPPFINGVSTSVCMLKRALEKLGHTVYVVTVNPDAMKYKYISVGAFLGYMGFSGHSDKYYVFYYDENK